MFVIKRDGHKEPVMFDKITARIKKLCYSLNPLVDPVRVSMRVIEGLYDGVTTSELDNLAAEIAATMTTTHPDYASLVNGYIGTVTQLAGAAAAQQLFFLHRPNYDDVGGSLDFEDRTALHFQRAYQNNSGETLNLMIDYDWDHTFYH